jgi:hypothetical protein
VVENLQNPRPDGLRRQSFQQGFGLIPQVSEFRQIGFDLFEHFPVLLVREYSYRFRLNLLIDFQAIGEVRKTNIPKAICKGNRSKVSIPVW